MKCKGCCHVRTPRTEHSTSLSKSLLPWLSPPPPRWHACHGPYLMDGQSCQVGCGGGSQQWPPFAAEGLRSCPAPLGRAAQTAGDRNRRRQSVLGEKTFSLEINRRDRLVRISGTMQHPYPSSIRVGFRWRLWQRAQQETGHLVSVEALLCSVVSKLCGPCEYLFYSRWEWEERWCPLLSVDGGGEVSSAHRDFF